MYIYNYNLNKNIINSLTRDGFHKRFVHPIISLFM